MDLPKLLTDDPQVVRLIELIKDGHTDLINALATVCFAIGDKHGSTTACDELTTFLKGAGNEADQATGG